MKPSEITPESRFNENASRLIGYGLVAAMMTCVAVTLISFAFRLSGTWQPWYLAVLVFITTLERLYTYRPFSKLSLFSSEWLTAYGTEWVVLLVMVKLVISLSHGIQAFLAEIPLWQVDFAKYFLSVEVFAAIGVVALVWTICGYYAELLDNLGLDQAILKREYPILQVGEEPARERLLNLIFSTGTLLIVLTATIRMNLRGLLFSKEAFSYAQLSILEGGGISTLLYFMFALALLSQTQFIDLHTNWSMQRIPITREVASRWARYSLFFLLLMVGLVSFLPTSYSLGVLNLLGSALNLGFGFLFYLVQVFVGVVLFLLSLLFMLLGQKSPVQRSPVAPAPEELIPTGELANPAWWEASKAIIFWILLAGILLFSLRMYLRQHQELIAELKKIRAWSFVAQIWKWLTGRWGNLKNSLDQIVEAGRKRLRRSAPRNWLESGFLNLRRLDPRQRVYFFYLALIRRSAESGLPRGLSQTPSEFATRLERALPEAEPEINALTEAFIEARYTPRPVEPEKANSVKEVWERIRKVLRGKKVESGK
jgi:hypothetical protein